MKRGAEWWGKHAPKQPCRRCGEPTYSAAAVPLHKICKPRAEPRPRESWAERKRRAAAVQAHRERYGEWCPGWSRPPHSVEPPNRLTADHVIPWKVTGREDTPLSVLCNRCNGRKQHRGAAPSPAPVGGVRPSPGRAERSAGWYSPSRDWNDGDDQAYGYSPSGSC